MCMRKKRFENGLVRRGENAGGYKFTLTDNDDFVRVDEPFTRKVDMKEGQDKKPDHTVHRSHRFSTSYQQLPEQFGFMKVIYQSCNQKNGRRFR